jgi:NAD(P)H-hydrate epimerase
VTSAVLTVELMAEADRRAIARGVPGAELMRNAGLAVAREVQRRFAPKPTLVLCGPGNNGGDGFVAATALASIGWPVKLALVGRAENLKGDAAFHAKHWHQAIEAPTLDLIDEASLIVDALFGAGLKRPLEADAASLLARAQARGIPILAVDVPSGVMGNTGESLGAVPSVCTVTFAAKKPAHLLSPGRELCGELVVADIGISPEIIDELPVDTLENLPQNWLSKWPHPKAESHKYARGHVLINGGYPMTGAARMAALAAARIGAGLTSVAVSEVAFPIYAASLTSIMVRSVSSDADFSALLADKRFTAHLIGPGAGADDQTRQRALTMLASGSPTVIDADAISVFAGRQKELFGAVQGACVLTPHEGEFKRLFTLQGDKLTRARAAAKQSGCIIVLKGADTVIAAPDGRAVINSNAPPTLATAGSGDVLSGLILGLLGQGMEAFAATCAAVYVHGAAAQAFGPGLIAEDLPSLIPGVLRSLLP